MLRLQPRSSPMYTAESEPTFEPAEAVVVVAKVPESDVIVPLYDVVDDEE